MNKPVLYVMMGLPASGKSTFAKQLKDTLMSNTVIISSDSIRKEWYGSESIQGNPNKLFEEMRKRNRFTENEVKNYLLNQTSFETFGGNLLTYSETLEYFNEMTK